MAEQLISTAMHHTLPHSYVRSEAERPRLDEVVPDADILVVVIPTCVVVFTVGFGRRNRSPDRRPEQPATIANTSRKQPAHTNISFSPLHLALYITDWVYLSTY
ncbi:hypothetical protein ZWY2020_039463 [Hordeum vulgare]|nr:hypothetical protein ZWY2020_039463 [Hordeum vulgare]